MKKYSIIVLVILIATGIVFSCKKDSNSKGHLASINDKTWWGELTKTGQKAENYSVHFNADHSLKWNELAGEYEGNWNINGKRLTINLPTPGVQIKADITDDDKLANIVTNNSSIVNSCKQIADPNISLDNTVWTGTLDYSGPIPLQLSFMPGNQIKFQSAVLAGTYTYSRTGSGAVIRYSNSGVIFFFGVIISGSEMRGKYGYAWQVTKQ